MSDRKYVNSRATIPKETARSVKVEAGHTCAIRGCLEHTYLEIHHINENREDNRIENLILLCDKHHKMAHANVIDRKSLHQYKKLMQIPDVATLLERFEKLESFLSASGIIPSSLDTPSKPINLVLEEAALLGNDLRGTVEGNEVAQQMFSLLRKHGNQMSVDSVDLMVRRGESYSRTGLIGLGILYDDFFLHTKSLNLVKHFESKDLNIVAYYCALREHFSDDEDMSACLRSLEFSWKGFRVVCNKEYLFSKYPNRGASVVLDCLAYENDNPEA